MIEESWLVDAVGNAIASLARRDLAVDVGANVGEWSRELCGCFARVVAFEPDLRITPSSGDGSVLEVRREAVCDRDGELTMHYRERPVHNSILAAHPLGHDGPSLAKATPCVTLDSCFPDGADFVKIDIEGAEVAALDGCRDPARWRRTAFVVECHDTATAVQERLLGLGKRLQLHPHPNPVAHPRHCWLIGLP